jgi:very-short-patch-repair endonuclease
MRKNPTKAERLLWEKLRFDQLGVRFRRQHPVGNNYILDFYCRKAKLGIEIDGSIHQQRRIEDEERTAAIEEMDDITIIRFTNDDVLMRLSWVMNVINKFLEARLPSHGGGGTEGGGERQVGEGLRMKEKVALVLFLLFLPFAASARAVISEVMWMGSDASTSDEWLEITGVEGGTGSTTDLSGWSLTAFDSSGQEKVLYRFGSGETLSAGEFAIIAHYHAGSSRLAAEPRFVTATLSLLNTKLLLRLRDANGAIADEADDGTGDPFAGSNAPTGKASMERIDLLLPGTVRENWRTATESRGFDSGSLLLGTPGFPNVCPSSSESSASSISSGTGSNIGSGTTIDPSPEPKSSSSESSSFAASSMSSIRGDTSVRITEILADAIGSDDNGWIEIGNLGDEPADIVGWSIVVGTKEFLIPPKSTGSFLMSPGDFIAFRKTETKLSLPHAGGTVYLRGPAGQQMDMLSYPEASEGVSYGRSMDDPEWTQQFCLPTEGNRNAVLGWNPSLVLQSGKVRDVGDVTLNVEVTKPYGFMGSMRCTVDFGDGEQSESCNPGSHTYRFVGRYTLRSEAANHCGTTVSQDMTIEVLAEETSAASSSVSSLAMERCMESAGEKQSSSSSSCSSVHLTGIRIGALLPNPVGKDTAGEWIELQNDLDEEVRLCGWSLGTGSGSKHFVLDEIYLIANGSIALPRSQTNIALRNTEESVQLISPEGQMQTVRYEKAKDGKILVVGENETFAWRSLPPKTTTNLLASLDEPSKESDQTISQKKGTNTKNTISKKSAKKRASSSRKSSAKSKSSKASKSSAGVSPDDPLLASLADEGSSAASWGMREMLIGFVILIAGLGGFLWLRKKASNESGNTESL